MLENSSMVKGSVSSPNRLIESTPRSSSPIRRGWAIEWRMRCGR